VSSLEGLRVRLHGLKMRRNKRVPVMPPGSARWFRCHCEFLLHDN
jgi:hypothetical protein